MQRAVSLAYGSSSGKGHHQPPPYVRSPTAVRTTGVRTHTAGCLAAFSQGSIQVCSLRYWLQVLDYSTARQQCKQQVQSGRAHVAQRPRFPVSAGPSATCRAHVPACRIISPGRSRALRHRGLASGSSARTIPMKPAGPQGVLHRVQVHPHVGKSCFTFPTERRPLPPAAPGRAPATRTALPIRPPH